VRFTWPDRSFALLEAALEWERHEPMLALAHFAINRVNAERFESYVLRGPGCWEWQGRRLPAGYGILEFDRRIYYAHRFAWMRLNGPIGDGLQVCHVCDNPPCCRDDHHFLGTAEENAVDAAAKGRKAGSRLTPDERQALHQSCIGATSARLTEIAAEFGVSYSTVSEYAKGLRDPSIRQRGAVPTSQDTP
jgi:hypothetical protein